MKGLDFSVAKLLRIDYIEFWDSPNTQRKKIFPNQKEFSNP